MKRLRVGIDVGGTFTDLVAIDQDTQEIVAKHKVPTTHTASEGVARGILQALDLLLAHPGAGDFHITLVAHSTTQATNALLEGDVARVGMIALGEGLTGWKTRRDTRLRRVPLGGGKYLETRSIYLHSGNTLSEQLIRQAIEHLQKAGIHAIVAAQAFSVDHPALEQRIAECARAMGLPATATHEISSLYGLKVRTRTAAVNAAILPRMIETTEMTRRSIAQSGILAPLRLMRSDGGVMDIEEVRHRPILTLLSGPAAGIAGALMHERVTDGIFLEVGGTSTDISVIQSGRPVMKPANIGGHRMFLNTLDVRTVGLAGGSMVRLPPGLSQAALQVGPRSAHIAGLPYACFVAGDELQGLTLETVSPVAQDPPEYVVVRNAAGKAFALTMTCAANVAGYIRPDHYAYAGTESARLAMQPLADRLQLPVEEAGRRIVEAGVRQILPVIEKLCLEYRLDKEHLQLVGGGGGAAAVVPALSALSTLEFRMARNAEYISTIGVALAMIKETIERNILNPTDQDILRVRREAEDSVLRQGANPATVEVHVEVDRQRNLVKATATGSAEMREKDAHRQALPEEEARLIASRYFKKEPKEVECAADTGYYRVYQVIHRERGWRRLLVPERRPIRVLDAEGIVRLQRRDARIHTTPPQSVGQQLEALLIGAASYGDAGQILPDVYLLSGSRMVDFSGLSNPEHIRALVQDELRLSTSQENVALLICPR